MAFISDPILHFMAGVSSLVKSTMCLDLWDARDMIEMIKWVFYLKYYLIEAWTCDKTQIKFIFDVKAILQRF